MDEVRASRRVSGDQYFDSLQDELDVAPDTAVDDLDGEAAKRVHRRCMSWFLHERTKQAANRLEMSIDADFYDGEQWDAEDKAVVEGRGQIPLVFNEVANIVDWLIGTERRTRVDWKVLPRAEDDVKVADIKTKVMKYVSDINRVPFARSRAFTDAIKVGVGWVDDGARDDPTADILYSQYQDWRTVLWDSASYELDLSDARYIFRWRWVDLDIALKMFPDRREKILRAAVDTDTMAENDVDADYYLGAPLAREGALMSGTAGVRGDTLRTRVKLIECQFRTPVDVQLVGDGPFRGSVVGEFDSALHEQAAQYGIVERVSMRVHVAVFTESDMISMAPSAFRHNRFSLTPIWCYRRSKDRLPYGAIRRVRDLQCDLNKRASKALFMLSTNQIIANVGAVEDKNVARAEADAPDGYIETNPGKEFKIHRDTDAATGQIQMMTLDAQTIQRSVGVNNENLGRQTNAQSGEAIKARQLQGGIATTEPFDNLRFAIQVQGEKQLSLIEQFYSEEKVVRLTGSRGAIDWLRVNQPERQVDGSVRYLNDITASAGDFVVSEQDFSGSLRQVMFDGISSMASRLPPEIAMRLFIIATDFSDLPNKDEIAEQMRKAVGERDPNKEMTPEEAQQAQQQMQVQAEALQIQREQAMLALEEQRAKVEKLNAEAAEIMARAQKGTDAGVSAQYEQALRQVQEQATQRLEAMAEQLRKVQMDAANKTMAINRDADTKTEVARIDAASRERVAEIQAADGRQIDALMRRLDEISSAVEALEDKSTPTAGERIPPAHPNTLPSAAPE